MGKNYESGHARNEESFAKLIGFCESFGNSYNPGVEKLKLVNLKSKALAVKAAMADCQTKQIALTNVINKRRIAYNELNSISQRAMATLEISGPTAQTLASAKTIYRKLKGRRASAKKEEVPVNDAEAEKQAKKISDSQQSFVNQAAFFGSFIELLSTLQEYTPNEAELQISGMQIFHAQLISLNQEVIVADAEASNCRKARNQEMYIGPDCMIDTGYAGKKYIKASYGPNSAEVAQVKGISFKRPRKL